MTTYRDAAGREPTARERALLAAAGIGSLTAFAFGAALYARTGIIVFLAVWTIPLVLQPRRIVEVLSCWPLWLLPALGMVSVLWSRDPDGTARSAVELAAFTLAAITYARLLDARAIMVSLVAALAAVALASLVSGVGDGLGDATSLRGLFGSKNALSLFCGVLAVTGLAGGLDRGMPALARLFCLIGALIGAGVGIAGRSVGGSTATAVAMAVLLTALTLARFSRAARRRAIAIALAAAVGVVALLYAIDDDRLADLLRLVGKTPDLTGRLYLWQRAREVIADHPWLGVGYQAFWRPQFPDALGLYRHSGIAAESGFHFHNLYVETAVELGVAGVVAIGVTLAAIAAASLARYDRRPDVPAALMLALVAFLLSRTWLEVDMLEPFSFGWLILVLVHVMAPRRGPAP